MARFHCRWRSLFIGVCTPCICLLLLLVFLTTMVCMTMNGEAAPGTIVQETPSHSSNNLRKKSFIPNAKTFWLGPNEGAFWNQLQLALDRYFNPILRPNDFRKSMENSNFNESLLIKSFIELTDSDSMRKNFDKLSWQMQKFVSNMQKRDYPAIIQPDGVCGAGAKDEKEPPLLLLAIKTTEYNYKNRMAIRQTWGKEGWVAGNKNSSGGYVRRVFLLGREDPEEVDVSLSELLRMESEHYGDILQWDFIDTFFNLTLKDVLFWSWFSGSCNQTVFVFKGDDDVFVNTPNIITYLQDQLNKSRANDTIADFMAGDVIDSAIPHRVNNSKYFIPDTFYRGHYPTYAGGGGVLYSGLLTKRLHEISKSVHLFPIDDVYVGMCMIRLNTHPIHHPAFLTFDLPEKEKKELCSYHKILLVHKRTPKQIVRLWADLKRTQRQCWDVPLRNAVKK
ncbi:N-acetyllactosaminide beta-1,3-N-acetylglucosaminyltransferase 2-like [Morone saxatilis]|uniref:N-acetyllactosaminide beta-1,3-N-acetylglucosaminyltransferase 2-like n=1 Tax=Morone saxatilis TaxID=34816 RepID=UPI0015E1D9B8|nr:N-acetyllactosaminide beta-1,3-N-acetylglucosaminyltransferase 2-like [Morone saxatilis]